MAYKKRPYWEEPEIEDWDDDDDDDESRSDRQILPFVLGFGVGASFGCFPRRFCFPRNFGCRPRFFNCRPRFCFPRQGCFPRPCWPL